MIPENILRNHVLKAIQEVDDKGIPKNRKSTKFQLLYDDKLYPPKYIISLANKYSNGKELEPWEFGGGIETNNFLKRLNFKIVDKMNKVA
ncbi:hypothetical protein ACQKFK_04370 [Bacillus mycoides]|uniref:hypothetical protein n=1 Tax=Bacillus mycoides TaxID=1405 RepID=UPI003D018397